MLITGNYSLLRTLRYTWKVDIFVILTCAATYYLHEVVFTTAIQIPPTIPTLLGTAIAFFIGFNNNQAYDRWWEARIIWGALINDSRSWARNIIHFTTEGNLEDNELPVIRKRMIMRHISFIYLLKNNLRKTTDQYYKNFLSSDDENKIRQESNAPNALLSLNAADLQRLSDENCVDALRFMQFNQVISLFTDHLGKCERIRNTIYPTSYLYFTSLFIWIFVIFTTLMLTDLIGAWSILIGWVIGFIYHVAHKNGISLMDPFDEVPMGIPLNQMARTIEINLLEMMGEKDLPEPVKAVNGEYIL